MLNFGEFIEFLRNLLRSKQCFRKEELSYLENKRLAIDVRFIAGLFIESLSRNHETTIQLLAESLLQRLEAAKIKPVFIFGGMEYFELDDQKYNARMLMNGYWNLRKRRFEANKLMDSVRRREEIKRIKRINNINLSCHLRYLEVWMDEALSSYFLKRKVDFLKAPQLREAQIVSLYNEGAIDGVVGGQICFMLGQVPNVIDSLDFEEKTFTFFRADELQQVLGFSSFAHFCEVMKIAMCLFKLDTSLHRSVSLVKLIQDKSLNDILRCQRAFDEETQLVFLEQLQLLKKEIPEDISGPARESLQCLEGKVNQRLREVRNLLDFIDSPVTFSLSTCRITGLESKVKYSLGSDYEELVQLFCLNVISLKFFGVFSKALGHEYAKEIEAAESQADFDISFYPLFSSLRRAIGYCSPVVDISQIEFCFSVMGTSTPFCVIPPKKKFIECFVCLATEASLSSVLLEFAENHHDEERYITLRENMSLSQKCIIEYLYIKFFDIYGIIDFASRSLTPLGELLACFTDTPFIEPLIYFNCLTLYGATAEDLPLPQETRPLDSNDLRSLAVIEAQDLNSWDIGIVSFMKAFRRSFPDIDMQRNFETLSGQERTNVRLLSRLAEFTKKDTSWNSQNDYDVFQFTHCYNSIRDAFNLTLTGEIINLLFRSDAFSSLSQIDSLMSSLAFQKLNFHGCTTLFSFWFGRFIVYKRLVNDGINPKDIVEFVSIPYIKQYHNVRFELLEFLDEFFRFLKVIVKFLELCLAHPQNPLKKFEDLLKQYLSAVTFFEEFYAVVSETSNFTAINF